MSDKPPPHEIRHALPSTQQTPVHASHSRPILFALLKPRRTRLTSSPSTTPARRTTPCPTTLGATLSDSNLSHTINSRTPRSRHRPIQTGTLQYQSLDSSFESTRDRFEDARYLPRLSTIKERNFPRRPPPMDLIRSISASLSCASSSSTDAQTPSFLGWLRLRHPGGYTETLARLALCLLGYRPIEQLP
ncbi:hypothetical protein HETIRDRAFT_453383 [Heterobasidion irregulare TC 32-1]|uniref:Uncharacterized protein n=1 Tax=Heterobasidion irregulare (strain TC 32-1) TaxID=747525 RepID=W4JZ19_HETIT|nr:uncharacterized protein HETIRDRAFT_453383 [Heterobasidion irregulare TC 32-1]ETW78808.1 hypothetical protein HETIRDRAFT_453383 [Heterobasidion irregulare TC 32-1]